MGLPGQVSPDTSALDVIAALKRQLNEQLERQIQALRESYAPRFAELDRIQELAQGDKRVYALLGPKEALMHYLQTHGGTATVEEVVNTVMTFAPGKFAGKRDAVHSARIMVSGDKETFRYNPKTDLVSLLEGKKPS